MCDANFTFDGILIFHSSKLTNGSRQIKTNLFNIWNIQINIFRKVFSFWSSEVNKNTYVVIKKNKIYKGW